MAYVSAIVAKAGYGIQFLHRQYKVDGTIFEVSKVNGKYRNSGYSIQFELKSSIDFEIRDGKVKYDLDAGNYNQLVSLTQDPNVAPQILILFCMPEDSEDWMSVTPEELVLRKCCFYNQFNGAREVQNMRTKTIEIPISQQFNMDSLDGFFAKLHRGERKLC
jgi:hypothetical protein